MPFGYMGKIVYIDLSSKKIRIERLKEIELKKYIGGSGLGAKYLHQYTGPETDPFSEDNVLIFMTGPLTGTKAFSSDRFEVVTKSPLTEIYTESDCGGTWGSMLKKSGYDGIIIAGKSSSPVFIWINEGKVEILDSGYLWGFDTFETQKKVKAITDEKAEVVCIGQGGENLVRYATISSAGKHARVAGRAGCGTVMGSKKLKAIAVFGTKEFEIFDEDGLKKFRKIHAKNMVDTLEGLSDYGTSLNMEYCERVGNLPIKNWSMRRFKDANLISGQTMASTI